VVVRAPLALVGTSEFCPFGTSLSGAGWYASSGGLDWRLVVLVGGGATVGAPLATRPPTGMQAGRMRGHPGVVEPLGDGLAQIVGYHSVEIATRVDRGGLWVARDPHLLDGIAIERRVEIGDAREPAVTDHLVAPPPELFLWPLDVAGDVEQVLATVALGGDEVRVLDQRAERAVLGDVEPVGVHQRLTHGDDRTDRPLGPPGLRR
jgi:hypothetical protein